MRVLMTGGGTGGHINPALAIANTIRNNEPDSEIAFVGTSRGLENKLVPKEGYDLYHVEIRGLKRSLSPSNLRTLWLSVTSVQKAKKLIREFKPDVCIGTGGYVCWPVIKAASLLGIPTALHESNALPGVAVRMLSKYADIIFTNFEESKALIKEKYRSKVKRVGNPLRGSFESITYDSARKQLGYDGVYTASLLSCGGSLGAERINSEILKLMRDFSSKHPELYHIHSTGSNGYQDFMKAFHEMKLDKYPNLKPVEYIYDMPIRLAAADLVINRAGAMTISELATLSKPAILIPSPNVTDNHQYKNAKVLEDAGAAFLIQESELSSGILTEKVAQILSDSALRDSLSRNFSDFAISDSNKIIYNDIKALVNSRNL